jgi:hypothetical protein
MRGELSDALYGVFDTSPQSVLVMAALQVQAIQAEALVSIAETLAKREERKTNPKLRTFGKVGEVAWTPDFPSGVVKLADMVVQTELADEIYGGDPTQYHRPQDHNKGKRGYFHIGDIHECDRCIKAATESLPEEQDNG